MNDYQARVLEGTRRQFLQRCGVGLGSMFLAGA
ncbi:MAG: twin-arginine translocation signal domain-containing protein, partial [Planctomycetes bacterium]|nr:twin-arginine translocation signal domain-containing protein [Planctomycetota bacterium]